MGYIKTEKSVRDMKIQFLEFRTKRLPSDRAMHTKDSSNFKIVLDDFLVREFSQYDEFYCHIKDYESTFRKARNFAEDLADILKLTRPTCQRMVEKKVEEVKWVPEESS